MTSPLTNVLDGAPWMWCAEARTVDAYCGFLRRFTGATARLHLFAASIYHLYVDGRLVNAGPVPFRAPVALADTYDLPLDPERSEHEVFVLVNHFGHDTKWCLACDPGLIAALEVDGARQLDAEGWSAFPLGCWTAGTPKITWARGGVEELDTRHPEAAVLRRYAGADHVACEVGPLPKAHPVTVGHCPYTTIRPRLTPYLIWSLVPVPAPPRILRTNPEVFNLNDLATRTLFEQWSPAYDAEILRCRHGHGARLHRRAGERGWILSWDLDRVCAGELAITVTAESPATIDLAFTERLLDDGMVRDGKPDMSRGGSRYVSRIKVGAGRTTARLAGFHGFRYVVVSAKDFLGELTVEPPTVHECLGDLPYRDGFASSDRVADLIHDISRRSVVLNTQAVCFDCNTRELGAYWGDGVWIADLAGHFSGDFRHLGHLCWGMVDEYEATGFLSPSLYGMGAPLFDYCLVPHETLRRHHQATADAATVRGTFPTAARILDDYLGCADEAGCVRLDRLKDLCEKRGIKGPSNGQLFLDHAGLGWHPRDTVAIDRRDVNGGLQCFVLQALRALSALAATAGVEDRWGSLATKLRTTIRERFLDPSLGLLRDARLDDGSFAGCSQVVNALAVTTGVFSDAEAKRVVRALLAIDERTDLAHSTPYGWFFIADAACRTGLVRECLAALRTRFEPMLARGATTVWEAFGGELHDSLNHAWSAVLPWLALRGLAGLRAEEPGYRSLSFTPALDALESCHIRGAIPQGVWELAWKRVGLDGRLVTVSVPKGIRAALRLSDGVHLIDGTLERRIG